MRDQSIDLISTRLSRCASDVDSVVGTCTEAFELPSTRGIKTIFRYGPQLSHALLEEDLAKFAFGLHGQADVWRTERFQGRTVRKDQVLEGLGILLRDIDKTLGAWNSYGIAGDGMNKLTEIQRDLQRIAVDASESSFPG